jgi:hypothetical protein
VSPIGNWDERQRLSVGPLQSRDGHRAKKNRYQKHTLTTICSLIEVTVSEIWVQEEDGLLLTLVVNIPDGTIEVCTPNQSFELRTACSTHGPGSRNAVCAVKLDIRTSIL